MLLVCYRSASESEIFNALGSIIVTALFFCVKGFFELLFTEFFNWFVRLPGYCWNFWYWVFKDLPVRARSSCSLFAQRGEIIPRSFCLSRVKTDQFPNWFNRMLISSFFDLRKPPLRCFDSPFGIIYQISIS